MSIRYDPFESMDRMFEQMRRSMFGQGPMFGQGHDPRGDLWGGDANLSLEPTDEGYLVMADLPGFEREEITVRFEDGVLSIAAAHESADGDEFGARRRSRRIQDAVRIPAEVVEDEVAATYRNGVLEVVLPTVEDVTEDEHVIDVE